MRAGRGALIGAERQYHSRTAGLGTHVPVAAGAATVMTAMMRPAPAAASRIWVCLSRKRFGGAARHSRSQPLGDDHSNSNTTTVSATMKAKFIPEQRHGRDCRAETFTLLRCALSV